MKQKLEYLLLKSFYLISKIIGINLSSFLGGILLSIFGYFSSRNSLAEKNLNYAFPKMNLNEKKRIIKKMWFHFGRVIGEYPHLNKIQIKNNPKIKIIGLDNLLNPLNEKKGCIFFSAHIGNWELSSHPLIQNGFEISFIYRAPNNSYVDSLLRKVRTDYGVNLIKKGKEGAKDCIRLLRKNENLGMLIDQKMNDGLPIKFFNEIAMTAPAIVKFAKKFKCPIIPAYCIREKGINFKIEYLPPLSNVFIKKLGSDENVLEYLNSIIEKWVIKYPEQWIWIHDRWKS